MRVEARDLMTILQRQDRPLVVHATGGFLSRMHRYLSSYRGLAFYAEAPDPLRLPGDAEIIEARKIWIPG